MPFREPKEHSPRGSAVAEVVKVYTRSEHRGYLHKKQMDLPAAVDRIAYNQDKSRFSEGLDHVLIVGGVVLGVTRTYEKGGSTLSQVRIVVLPIGEQAGVLAECQSSATIADISTKMLDLPRPDGVTQPWEDIKIGRDQLAKVTGSSDDTISRKHLTIKVRNDGVVRIVDHSTNGTTVVSLEDMMRSERVGGLADGDRETLVRFAEPLEENPYLWQENYAGQRVINPE